MQRVFVAERLARGTEGVKDVRDELIAGGMRL